MKYWNACSTSKLAKHKYTMTNLEMRILLAGLQNLTNSCRSYDHNPDDQENNITCNDESNWLHRSDAYQMQQIGGRLRAIPLLDGHKTQTIHTITRENHKVISFSIVVTLLFLTFSFH